MFRRKSRRSVFWPGWTSPEKNWKFSVGDIHEREYWDEYQDAYEDMIRNTATEACALVCGAGGQQVVHAAGDFVGDCRYSGVADLAYPKVDDAKKKELEEAKEALLDRARDEGA